MAVAEADSLLRFCSGCGVGFLLLTGILCVEGVTIESPNQSLSAGLLEGMVGCDDARALSVIGSPDDAILAYRLLGSLTLP